MVKSRALFWSSDVHEYQGVNMDFSVSSTPESEISATQGGHVRIKYAVFLLHPLASAHLLPPNPHRFGPIWGLFQHVQWWPAASAASTATQIQQFSIFCLRWKWYASGLWSRPHWLHLASLMCTLPLSPDSGLCGTPGRMLVSQRRRHKMSCPGYGWWCGWCNCNMRERKTRVSRGRSAHEETLGQEVEKDLTSCVYTNQRR